MRKLFGIVCIVLCGIVAGCSGSGGHDPIPTIPLTTTTPTPSPTATPNIVFQDKFDSYPLGKWNPVDPYLSCSGNWVIEEGGEDNHYLKTNASIEPNILMYNDSSFCNGTINIKFSFKKHNNLSGFSLYIGGRNKYALKTTTFSTFEICDYTSKNETQLTGAFFRFYENTQYTLSLSFNGKQITGMVTDGVNSLTIKANDALYQSGPITIWCKSGIIDNTIIKIDDFMITTP